MDYVLKGASVYINGRFEEQDITVIDDKVDSIGVLRHDLDEIDCTGCHIFPGFIDVHVHFREPGFEYKETIKTGSLAAAHGGYTAVCTMPNLNPVPDSLENITKQLDIIKKDAVIDVYPFAAITKSEKGIELSDMDAIASDSIGFSDDGKGVQSIELMEKAMEKAKKLNKIISAHCEDNTLLDGGYIHNGEYAKKYGHRGICSESEWKPIKRDIELAAKIGCKYHVCHVSTKESVEIIRQAKKRGISVTCETGPHYLVFDDSNLQDNGRFKMNPPIRSKEDRLALLEGIKDGTIDMIATDHAPHSAEEKEKGLKDSLMGIVGLETAFPVLYTKLVKTGIITLEKLVAIMHDNAMERFGIGSDIEVGKPLSITVFDLSEKFKIDSDKFLSKGKCTPFEGEKVYGKCKLTIHKGVTVWKENLTER